MQTGILLVNLGTPSSPATGDVRTYLTEFLNDPRVIDIPWLSRKMLVNLIIVPFRASRSAALYKKVWTKEGSPLMVHSVKLRDEVQRSLGDAFDVRLAMRYGQPSIESVLQDNFLGRIKDLVVIPLYPQYASSSTGSVVEEVMTVLSRRQVFSSVKFVNSFFDHPAFINAWISRAKEYDHHQHDHVIFSFHGLPERQIRKADVVGHCLKDVNCCSILGEKNHNCYRAQCYYTARTIAQKIDLPPEKYSVAFQSRLGRDPWIKPFTDHIITDLAKSGKKKLLVFAPAFVSDCLETLYEIAVEYDELFKKHGG